MKKIGLFSLFALLLLAGCAQNSSIPLQSQKVLSTSGTLSLLDIVGPHADTTSCWTVISGNVYDLTSFIGKHPGGDKAILSSCGKDSTQAFDAKHGMDPKKWEALQQFKVMAQ